MKIVKGLVEKTGESKLNFIKNPIFIIVLLVKIVASFFFASTYLTDLFIKFTNYYVISGFQNPYQYFVDNSVGNEFPYPALMLYIMAIPRFVFGFLLGNDYNNVNYLNLFVARIPILIGDFAVLVILMRWLKSKQEKVLRYYWCSPILFYINYIHGQLDVIPIMFVVISLYYLFKGKEKTAFILLGLSICTKTNVALVIPFYLIYTILKRENAKNISIYFALMTIAYIVPNIPFIPSPEFWNMVFNNKEQLKIFELKYNFDENLYLYLLPAAYLFLLLQCMTYKSFNKDLFIMYIGFSFTVLTVFIPPMQGWYYWSLPFVIYFYIKQENTPKFSFILLNVFYFAYFGIIAKSDYLNVFHFISPKISEIPNLYLFLQTAGFNSDFAVNITFTFLQATLIMNGLWIYKMGIYSSSQYKLKNKPYIIGVGGDSGVGKSTFSEIIQRMFGNRNTMLLCGDDMHKWERGNENWNTYTHLNPKANKLHKEMESIVQLKNGRKIERNIYDHSNGQFTLPTEIESNKLVILEGLHPFYIAKMRDNFDLKIFIKPVEELRYHWKIVRDIKKRSYSKEQIIESIKKRDSDSEKYIIPQEKYANIVLTYDVKNKINDIGNDNEQIELILKLKFENEINIDELIFHLQQIETLDTDHYYDIEHQFLIFSGFISLQDVERIGYLLIPEIEDININEIEWEENFNGLIQIFCGYYIFKKMKLSNEYH